MIRSVVAIRKTTPETVIQDIEWIARRAGLERFFPKENEVILKDNISWHFPFLSANTTPWQLEGAILALRNLGYRAISSVHNNTVVTNPFKGLARNKLAPVYKKYNIEERFNFVPEDIRWVDFRPKAKMRVLDQIYPEGIQIPDYFIGKNIVHLPTLKTHIYTTTTGAMKNAFGGLLNTRRHYTHSVIHETLVDLLAIQQEIHTGIFAVMDGTICGNGPGPRTMIPVEKGYILASGDCVAIDAVSSRMMGFDPMSIPYLRMAHEAGLGTGRVEEIEIVGDDISEVDFHFSVGDNLASTIGDALWFGPFRGLQRLFFRTPLVYVFVLGSFLYHDYFWWPLKGKKLQKELVSNTPWGRIFDSYPSHYRGTSLGRRENEGMIDRLADSK